MPLPEDPKGDHVGEESQLRLRAEQHVLGVGDDWRLDREARRGADRVPEDRHAAIEKHVREKKTLKKHKSEEEEKKSKRIRHK